MGVIQRRLGDCALVAPGRRLEALLAFHDLPAIVGGATRAGCDGGYVDFLDEVFPDIGYVEIPRRPIEAEAPGIAQADAPDLPAPDAHARVVRGNAVRLGGLIRNVDAQKLAIEHTEILRAVQLVRGGPAVAP